MLKCPFPLHGKVAYLRDSLTDGQYVSESECDIRKNFDTNEYTNIFVSNELAKPRSYASLKLCPLN